MSLLTEDESEGRLLERTQKREQEMQVTFSKQVLDGIKEYARARLRICGTGSYFFEAMISVMTLLMFKFLFWMSTCTADVVDCD